jgi:protein-tyrosine-phosphatase
MKNRGSIDLNGRAGSPATILFVCVHNAGRSVMAESLFNQRARGIAKAESAGTQPAERPHQVVVEAMREVGIDVSGHRGRLITDEMVAAADRVITMGCAVDAEACPAIRYRDVEDWGLPDPAEEGIAAAREIREEIAPRVEALLAELASPEARGQ